MSDHKRKRTEKNRSLGRKDKPDKTSRKKIKKSTEETCLTQEEEEEILGTSYTLLIYTVDHEPKTITSYFIPNKLISEEDRRAVKILSMLHSETATKKYEAIVRNAIKDRWSSYASDKFLSVDKRVTFCYSYTECDL